MSVYFLYGFWNVPMFYIGVVQDDRDLHFFPDRYSTTSSSMGPDGYKFTVDDSEIPVFDSIEVTIVTKTVQRLTILFYILSNTLVMVTLQLL